MTNKIFITGSEGYIGNHLARFLKQKKFIVYGCDTKIKANNSNFIKSDFSSNKVIKFIKQKKINHILHLAALTEIKNDRKYKIRCRNINYFKSKIFVQKIFKEKIFLENFIFASSAAVYGISKNVRIKETHKTKPISTYGKTKLDFENYLTNYKENFSKNIFICRFFNVVGGNLLKIQKKSIFNYIKKSLKNKKPFFINGKNYKTLDGTAVRDYIDIDILSKFILFLIRQKSKNKENIFNVGSGVGLSILQILNFLKKNNFDVRYYFKKKRKKAKDIEKYKGTRQAEVEAEWDKIVVKNYSTAKKKAEQALKLL